MTSNTGNPAADNNAKLQQALAAWAEALLDKWGFGEEKMSRATADAELDRIRLDRKNMEVEIALSAAVESGVESTRKGRERNCFAHTTKEFLWRVLQTYFESRKRARRRQIEEEIKAAAQSAGSASASAEFEGSPADPT